MRVLWLTTDRSQRVAQLFDPLRREFSKLADVESVKAGVWTLRDVARGRRDAPQVKSGFANEFDLVFTDAPFAYLSEPWGKIRVPTVMLVEDQHGPYVPDYVGRSLDAGVRYAFVRYRHGLGQRLPRLVGAGEHPRISEPRWLPHCIDASVFRPWSTEKHTRILVTGSAGRKTYPLRAAIADTIRRHPRLGRVIDRPPEVQRESQPRGRAYAEQLCSARIATATGAIFQYVVAKYFEIPACGACLLSPILPDLADLGFLPHLHYIPLNADRLILTQLEDALADLNRVACFAECARERVQERHTAEVRARELFTHFEQIIQTG